VGGRLGSIVAIRMTQPPFSAVILAAGRSTRMGSDKALLTADDGVPLWQRQRDVLAAAGAAEIFLSVRPEQTWARRAPGITALLFDAVPGGGPLIGITAGLERAAHPLVAVIAVDLPRITAGWFETLLARCSPGVGAVGRRDAHFEPLAAVYPREIMPLAWAAIARGSYALQPLLTVAVAQELMRAHEIGDREAPAFENWNRPERPERSG